jgi:photosystem II stability/assembly factor-like uncharacterized protein
MKRKIKLFLPLSLLVLGVMIVYISNLSQKEEVITKAEPESAGFDKPEGFLEYFQQITVRIGEEESGYLPNSAYKELLKAKKANFLKKSSQEILPWVMRGPGNVGGRTRSVIVDPDDASGNTWFAGTASGGIWKTTDAGDNWIDMAPDLPNLAATELSMAPSNSNIIYAGTGEGYGGVGMVTGNGIFVSYNKGQTWSPISSTEGNVKFSYVNRIWVDPADENTLIAATNTGIYKSIDGGSYWTIKYESGYKVQDLYQNPQNPNVLFAGVNTKGILKSTDRGETWIPKRNGFGGGRRYEVAVSNVDTSNVFAVVENPDAKMDVYISQDGGENWRRELDVIGSFYNFHMEQGWYNSVVEPHPFNANEAYVAGVHMGKVSFGTETSESDPMIINVDTIGTNGFMAFVNFGGGFIGGGMKTGFDESANVNASDFTSVEIRFGPGKSQKAHRFLVPDGEGPGVPAADYIYQDYVDVPFEVWDTDNNIQLMVSFRDQERDGNFNLIQRNQNDQIPGREYIFVQAIPYNSENPSPLITKNAGHHEKMLYFFWPTLAPGGIWDRATLPESKIFVDYGTIALQKVVTSMIQGIKFNTNLHVDHHDLIVLPGATTNDPVRLIDANDGGVGLSENGGLSWEQKNNGFFTSQFYGVAKKPGVHEYIGGMQDNGTWQSPNGEEAIAQSSYNYRIGGDGFEVLWNNSNTSLILGSTYNNKFKLSTNGGGSWADSKLGITDWDGPFISKLSNSRLDPDVVFAISSKGIYRNLKFGSTGTVWELKNIGEGWTINETAYSSHQVKVSLADKLLIWAGAGMYENSQLNLFLSKDQGITFNAVNNYSGEELGFCSGLATHPKDPGTAYLLFSFKSAPKIIRTTDYGETWEDISGFEGNEVSSNGFPDVILNDLLVMPYNTDIIWAATEIGIFESLDNGNSWHYADNGLPAVSVFQLQFQDDAIIAATHGRGIWTTEGLPQSVNSFKQLKKSINVYPNPVSAQINYSFDAGNSGSARVNIFNLNGGKVISESIKLFPNERYVNTMDVTRLSPATYIIEISDNESIYSSRFVKK